MQRFLWLQMDRFVFQLLSFFVSVLLYLALILFATHIFFSSVKKPKKIAIKAQSIDVYIQEPQKKKSVMRAVKKQTTPKKKRHPGSTSPKRRPDLKSLFASLHTPKSPIKKRQTHSQTPSRYKGVEGTKSKAKELLKKLKLRTAELSSSKKMIKSVTGEHDPYLEKVYKILYTNWIPSQASAGNRAKVKIFIDSDGRFSYEILQPGASEIFNQELQNYLEYLKTLTFPKPAKKRELIVYFEAKD